MTSASLLLAIAAAIHATDVLASSAQDVLKFDLYACARPVWPAAALAVRASGTTTLEVRISKRGLVVDARVTDSAGRPDMDAAALAAMRDCPFPAVLATGEAPTGWLKTRYKWRAGSAAAAPDGAVLADILQRADAGDAVAQNLLGSWYQHGTHVKADAAQAAIWYERAAHSGNAVAQNNLGVLYFRGLGVPRDPRQAAHWYEKAAEQGHGWAQANLAWAYEFTLGNDINPASAMYWLTKAADGGLAHAQMRLGRSFELGLGNPQDDGQAAALYRKALGRTDGQAETALGMLIEAGRVPALEHEDAARLYEQGMAARHANAFHRYGLVLEQRGEIALAGALFKLGAWQGSCEAVHKYVELRPVALEADPMDSDPAHWRERSRLCAASTDLSPQR